MDFQDRCVKPQGDNCATHNHLVKPQGGLGSRTLLGLGGLHARGYTHPLLCGVPQSGSTRARGKTGSFWENDMSPDQGLVHAGRIYQKLSIPLSLKEIGMRWETLNRVIPNLYSFLLESAALVWPADQI
ncbi:hypothetical protein EVAR_100645_1 [Eumeta japonica]|uniref:Uncharacterized protein n=1 Tax=Eumeta variegata TaxID=151549 RepID=A0A4C1T5C9_EUMVA|nr:hypothetical protein EVAR_100645_1 [Eumeta japonica]